MAYALGKVEQDTPIHKIYVLNEVVAGGQCCDLVRHCCPSIYDNVTILKTLLTSLTWCLANVSFTESIGHHIWLEFCFVSLG